MGPGSSQWRAARTLPGARSSIKIAAEMGFQGRGD
jgi:hypothetical protein